MAKPKTEQRGRAAGRGPKGRQAQRTRAIQARKAAEAAERRRRLRTSLIFGTVLLLAVGAIVAGVVFSLGKDSRKLPTSPVATATPAPPWTAPADPTAGIAQAGLRSAQSETFGEHFHPHLDIRADGKPVSLPAQIGIGKGAAGNVISEIHTHSTDGVIHVEAPDKTRRFVLGQLFAELGVKLDATHLGNLTAGSGKELVGYVNGKRFDGNPAQIELLEHRQIALVFGTPEQQANPPATFDFKKAGV